MGKKICKEDKKPVVKQAGKVKFKCKACGAEAEKEKHLCKPKKH
jgi:hypothetical protein